MITEKSNQVMVVKDILLREEAYELLDLMKKAVSEEIKGKTVICRTPFHKNSLVHCVIELLLVDYGVFVKKEPKDGSQWPWPTLHRTEEFRSKFDTEKMAAY